VITIAICNHVFEKWNCVACLCISEGVETFTLVVIFLLYYDKVFTKMNNILYTIYWAHNSGSIQVWGTRLYFVTWYVFTVRIFSHSTQSLSWSTNPCRLCTTSYSMYSQLSSILEAVPLSATWGCAVLWWRAPIYLGYIAYCNRFILTNDSEAVLSVCIINTTVFFLLDMFHSKDPQERSRITPWTSVGNSVL